MTQRHSLHSNGGVPSAPYVIKLGGRALEASGAVPELAASIAELDGPVVLVHGGGYEVSAWCRRLGLEPRFEAGLRVTDAPTLEVAAAVLGGLANARLVASLRASGLDAVGLSAAAGGLIEAEPHPDAARLGRVGIAARVDSRLLELLLNAGYAPVVSSLGALDGALINLNADAIAGALAAAMQVRALMMLSDVDGLTIDGRLVPELHADELPALLGRDDVRDGMIPKLQAAERALAAGASRVVIAAWHGPGTLRRLLEGAIPATTVLPSAKEAAHV